MKTHLIALLAGTAVLLCGCGTAGDTAANGTDGTPDRAPDSSAGTRPTEGPWPAYEVQNYTFTLRTSCFCVDRGVPVVVTVRDGRVTDAVYARTGMGHRAGEPAGRWLRVSINDVIDAANTQDAYQVRVRWPEDQDYPTSVWVDRDRDAADEEIGYSIRDVSSA